MLSGFGACIVLRRNRQRVMNGQRAVEKIAAVLFDWGGVLIEDPAPGLMAYCAEALDVSVEDYVRVHGRHAEAFQKGSIAEEVFWERVCGDLNRPEPQVASLWGRAFRAVYSPREAVFALARQLHEKDYRIALLSNTEAAAMDFFLELNYDMFDALTFSCAEGAFKPERKIYEIAARKLPGALEQCVLIDDRLGFVEGARKAGMKGIAYESLPQATRELAALGVQVD